MIRELAEKVIQGGEITKDEAIALIHTPAQDTMLLLTMADKIRQHFHSDDVDTCAIINARSGKCSENCRFCAQSAHHQTGVEEYALLDVEELVEAAKKAKEAGAIRFSLVTSGRNTGNPREFETVLEALRRIKEEVQMEVCCSLGLITYEQAVALKELGVSRFHSNIETAPSHFPSICTTHSFEDKKEVLSNVHRAGLPICSGGILGLGETPEQRVEMAFTLKELGVTSVPLNILNPIKGTPLENQEPLQPFEILRTFAVFRFILPKAVIRTAGGREKNLRSLQALALNGGLNGIMIGGYLTTDGRDPKEDLQMLTDMERPIASVPLA